MLDKQLIKSRKEIYGDNFACIAEHWGNYLDIQIEGKEVAVLMAHLKQCRIEAIEEKLSNGAEPEIAVKLLESLKDSKKDLMNYLWIGSNFEEYKNL